MINLIAADFGLATKIPKGKTANSKCGSCFYMVNFKCICKKNNK